MSDDDEYRVALPSAVRESLEALYAQKSQTENQIKVYVRALQDSLDIKGPGWTLVLEEMAFIHASPNGKAEADVVEAVAVNSTD